MTERVRRRDKRIWFVVLGVFVAVFLFTFLAHQNDADDEAEALTTAGFDPGYIISDYQMGNYNSMNEAEIQNFLKSKNSCNDTNIGKYTVGDKVSYFSEMSPPRTWHVKDGHFVCMADEVFDGGTAAHIIYRAAQDYRINPQVLLVLLEKEQSLVTDTFPHSQQYRSATGYGCPDTAACSSKYYGLQNQIRNAAALFRTVLDGGWTNYPLGDNYVQYNPNASCGGSVVNIRNLATSALYRYTPYQPNAATLGGWNDGCNAYGNINFYSLFQRWFGGITDTVYVKPVVEAKTNYEHSIPDGTYQLVSKAYPGMAIDIRGGIKPGMTSGDLQMYKRRISGADNQVFNIKYNEEDGYYNIVNAATGFSFDVKGARTVNSTLVGVWPYHSECNQDWLLKEDEEGYYTIISRCSSKALDATASKTVVIFDEHNGDNQKWELVRIGSDEEHSIPDGTYQLVSKAYPGMAIDIRGGIKPGMTSGDLQMYKRRISGADNQVFNIKYNEEDGYYNIVNAATGFSFDVKGARTVNSTLVGVWPYHSECNQDWLLKEDEEGYYTIISRCSSKALDATASKTVVIFDEHNGDNQKWELVRMH